MGFAPLYRGGGNILGRSRSIAFSLFLLFFGGELAHAKSLCDGVRDFLGRTPSQSSQINLQSYFTRDVMDEIALHTKKKFHAFHDGVDVLVEGLPSDAKSKRDQLLELNYLQDTVSAAARAGQKGPALTFELAQKMVALAIREGTRVERWTERQELATQFELGRKIDERRLLDIERDLSRRDAQYYFENRGPWLLHALSKNANDLNVRVEAHLMLAELGAIDKVEGYSFDSLFQLFPQAGVPRKRLIAAIHSWPEPVFERLFFTQWGYSFFSKEELATLFEGRSADFLARFFHKPAEIRAAATRALIGNRDPGVIDNLRSLLTAELKWEGRKDLDVFHAAIDALRSRVDRESLELLGQLSAGAKDASVRAAAATAIVDRRRGPAESNTSDSPALPVLVLDARPQVGITLIQNARHGVSAKTRMGSHKLLLETGRGEYLEPRDISQILKDWKAAAWTEKELAAFVQRLPDEMFFQWARQFDWSEIGPEQVPVFFQGRSSLALDRFLRDKKPEIRSAAAQALIGNYEPEAATALEGLVTRELTQGGPGMSRVLLSAIDALKNRTDKASLDALDKIVKEGPKNIANVAGHAILSDFRLIRHHFGEGYDLRSQWDQSLDVIKDLTNSSEGVQLAAVERLRYLHVVVSAGNESLRPFAVALDSPHEKVRIKAMDALLGRTDPESRNLAIRVSKNPNEFTEVGKRALRALARMDHPDAVLAIRNARQSTNERVRREAINLSHGANETGPVEALRLPGSLGRMDENQLRVGDRRLRTAAGLAYLFPEPRPFKAGGTLFNEYERLERMVPEGETLVGGGCDLPSSFKWIAIESVIDGRKVLTIGIAGSQTFTDWLVDFNFGFKQITNPEYMRMRDFAMKKFKDGFEVEIGGHSLGGVATQTLAYELEKAKANIVNPSPVRFATFCGLGAVTAMTRLGNFDPQIAAQMNGMNYRFTGDLVSRIGPQIGQSVSIPGAWNQRLGSIPGLRNVLSLLPAVYADHLMTTLGMNMDVTAEGSLPAPAPVSTSPLSPVLYPPLGFATESVAALGYTIFKRQYLRSLQEASLQWAKRRGYRDGEDGFRPFDNMIEDTARNIGDSGDGWVARTMASFDRTREELIEQGRRRIRQYSYSRVLVPDMGN